MKNGRIIWIVEKTGRLLFPSSYQHPTLCISGKHLYEPKLQAHLTCVLFQHHNQISNREAVIKLEEEKVRKLINCRISENGKVLKIIFCNFPFSIANIFWPFTPQLSSNPKENIFNTYRTRLKLNTHQERLLIHSWVIHVVEKSWLISIYKAAKARYHADAS